MTSCLSCFSKDLSQTIANPTSLLCGEMEEFEVATTGGFWVAAGVARVNVDTTVQEKAIAFPTDGHPYHRIREKLVVETKEVGVKLRQTYTLKSKRALIMQGRYRHARQARRANKELRKRMTCFGRVLRDLDRKTRETRRSQRLQELLNLGYRLF